MSKIKNKDFILNEFKSRKATFHSFRDRMKNLLSDLITTQNLAIHQVSCRTKTLNSLTKKIEDKNNKYNSIDDITDIVGIRIITYLESDVDAIAKLIEAEFKKDSINSVDKRKLNIDQFGYKSLHIVVSLNDMRSNLKEFLSYKNLKCEIQIRSILQHAWAEIEHDLGYKSDKGIPDRYKRTFNRLSALLETADVEFDRLKKELKDYDTELPELINNEPENVDLNNSSLSYLIEHNLILQEAKQIIKQQVGSISEKDDDDFDVLVTNLNRIELFTIEDLEIKLKENKDEFLKYAKLAFDEDFYVSSNISVFAFITFLIMKHEGIIGFTKYFEFNQWDEIDMNIEKEVSAFTEADIDYPHD